ISASISIACSRCLACRSRWCRSCSACSASRFALSSRNLRARCWPSIIESESLSGIAGSLIVTPEPRRCPGLLRFFLHDRRRSIRVPIGPNFGRRFCPDDVGSTSPGFGCECKLVCRTALDERFVAERGSRELGLRLLLAQGNL